MPVSDLGLDSRRLSLAILTNSKDSIMISDSTDAPLIVHEQWKSLAEKGGLLACCKKKGVGYLIFTLCRPALHTIRRVFHPLPLRLAGILYGEASVQIGTLGTRIGSFRSPLTVSEKMVM